MSQPCADCLASSWLLSRIGGHIDVLSPSRRPKRLLALDSDAVIAALGGAQQSSIKAELAQFRPEVALRSIEACGMQAACRHSGAFAWPVALEQDPEPPWVLHAIGDTELLCDPGHQSCVAIVGARRADGYGRSTARLLAREVAERGGTVVSGMAIGIDTEAHRGALEATSGRTLAVLGGGLDRPYPVRNRALCEEISASGCVVSEMPPGTGVWRWSFPARNRLVAAFSQVVTVVQAAAASGSLHTAEAGLSRGRTVAAVPGPISNDLSAGSNRLIADGAMAIIDPDSLCEAAGLARPGKGPIVPVELEGTFEAVRGERLEAELASAPDGGSRILADVARLELIGAIIRDGGGGWQARS